MVRPLPETGTVDWGIVVSGASSALRAQSRTARQNRRILAERLNFFFCLRFMTGSSYLLYKGGQKGLSGVFTLFFQNQIQKPVQLDADVPARIAQRDKVMAINGQIL